MEFDHPFHPEHKLVYKKRVKKADNAIVCAACIEDISSEHYSCGECFFFLHKSCAERPFEFTHSSHPLHPLRVLPKLSPYGSGNGNCNACGKSVEGFVYHCAICKFNLDFICTFSDGTKMNHSCHRAHVLNYEKVVKRADEEVVCAACLDEITGPLANYYSCRKCNFFVHELCSKQPQELISSLHPHHPLRLLPKDPYDDGTGHCNRCKKAMKGFVYNCDECHFSLDFKCAFREPEKSVHLFENVHNYPLMLITTPAKFRCSVCSPEGDRVDEQEYESYICFVPGCNFWIHKMCAFTTLAQRYKDHHHPLFLRQGVPEDLHVYKGINCHVCRKAIYPTDWVAYCDRCTYFVHIACTAVTGETKDGVDYLDDSLMKLILNGDKFVEWPLSDISSELIRPFLLGKNSIGDVQPKIRHLSHMQHDMILFEELFVNNDSFFEEEDEEVMCDACISPITAPYYCCQECNYYMHVTCANLPPKIKHFSHPHELIRGYRTKFYEQFICNRCDSCSNGFNYFCKTCDFNLDLISCIMIHVTHGHPLLQMEAKDEGACYACGKSLKNGDTIFKCTYCNIFIDFHCAMYALSIRHRWDRHHPLYLKFPPHDRPRGHFMCDMCEELITPMYWLYLCFDTEVSFHTYCAPRYMKKSYQNIKFGGQVRLHSHPHVLKFLREPTLKSTCDKCGSQIKQKHVFECEICYDCICYRCVADETSLVKSVQPDETYQSSYSEILRMI